MEKEHFIYLEKAFCVLMKLMQSPIHEQVVKALDEEGLCLASLSRYVSLEAPQPEETVENRACLNQHKFQKRDGLTHCKFCGEGL